MKKNRKKKVALVLSGGGFNGAFQLGALNYINENWTKITGLKSPMKFDVIAGVSVGALNGSLLAMNQLSLLNDLWLHQIASKGVKEIYTSDVIDTENQSGKLKLKLDLKEVAKKFIPEIDLEMNLFGKLGLIFSKEKRKAVLGAIIKEVEQSISLNFSKFRSVANNSPLRKKLVKYLDRSQIKNTKFLCGFVSLDSGKYHGVLHHQFESEDDFVKGVLASTAIPMIWEPVGAIRFQTEQGAVVSENNVDGGVRNISPLGDVIKLINEDTEDSEYKVIIINCNSGVPKKEDYSKKSIAGIAGRSMYEIAMNEVFNNDVNHFMNLNKIVNQAQMWDNEITLFNEKDNEIRSFQAVVINPHKDIEMGNPLVANEQLIHHRMAHGKAMAQNAFENKNINNE